MPWPSPDIFARLPWREQILTGLLGADVVAFHTDEYRGNFLRSCARLLGGSGIEVHGSSVVMPDGRVVATSTAPISIDAAEYSRLASELGTDEEIEALVEQFSGRTVLLGVDRLDYTKGIVERLLAVEMLLERNPELRSRLVFLQIAVPSRDNVREYRQLRTSVEQLIGRINGVFTEPGGDVPVHYLYRSLSPRAARRLLRARRRAAGHPADRRHEPGLQGVRHGPAGPRRQRRPRAQRVHRRRGRAVPGHLVQPVRRGRAVLPDRAGAPADRAGTRAAMAAMADHVRTHDVHRWVSGQLAQIAARGLGQEADFDISPRSMP